MASGIYNIFKSEIMKKTVDMVNDTIKIMLLNNSHSFNADHDEKADIVANEISGTGYTAGGATLGSKAVTVDNTDDEGVFDAADASWTSASFTAYHAVIYDDTLTSPADMLICSIDFGGAQTVTAGTFQITFAAEGIININ
jgi:hypothetical protein